MLYLQGDAKIEHYNTKTSQATYASGINPEFQVIISMSGNTTWCQGF